MSGVVLTEKQKAQARLAETMARVNSHIAAYAAEEAEKRAALSWCRANGNPHRAKAPTHAE
ncbi:hypothetical protein ACWGM0_10815 [Sphingomonas bisphenolicum]